MFVETHPNSAAERSEAKQPQQNEVHKTSEEAKRPRTQNKRSILKYGVLRIINRFDTVN